jgi:ubiquinone/menaquinone biosynthesis C-methylase UbiE
MVERKNRRYHDRVAGRYDAMYDRPYWRFYRDLSWRHLARFLPEQRPAWAADLGCGTGWFGRKLLKAGFDVIFLDPSGRCWRRPAPMSKRMGCADATCATCRRVSRI